MLLCSVVLIFVVFVLLIIAGIGVAAFRLNSTLAASVCEVISRIAFIAAMLTLLLVVVPRIREVFPGFGVELPCITVLVLSCNTSNLWQSIVTGLLVVAALVADGILFAIFHDQKRTRRTTQWCSFAMTLILTATPFFMIAALSIPMIRLINDLP